MMTAVLSIGMGLLFYSSDNEAEVPRNTAIVSKSKADALVQICINDKCGYINGHGKIIIPPRFGWSVEAVENGDFAANGLAVVEENGKWGYINIKGEMVISPKFDWSGGFSANGFAQIRENDKYGLINAKGDILIMPMFEGVRDFASNGLAMVENNEKYGYINTHGDLVVPTKYEFANNFAANGLALVKENGKWGFINAKGEMVISTGFESASSFSANGLALIRNSSGKYGYINAKGEVVIQPQFEDAKDFGTNGLAWITQNKKVGFINENGEIVIPANFDSEHVYWNFYFFDTNGLARVKKDKKYGYINTKGEVVVPITFETTWGFSSNGLAVVGDNGKYGYVNIQGELMIPLKFDEARSFNINGLAAVKENGKWGFINTKGKMVTPFKFDEVSDFEANGLVRVVKNGKSSFINAKGHTVVTIDRVCDVEVLKNSRGKILWPQKTSAQICEARSKPENTAETAEQSGIAFSHGDWELTCDNILTCRMEGATEGVGSVLITRAAGPNAPLHGEVTLADIDEEAANPLPPSLTLLVGGKNKGQLRYPGGEGGSYPLTQTQTQALLAGARTDKEIVFKGGKEPFVLFGNGISAVMLKMDEFQGRIDTSGALIRKGKKSENSVRAPVPKPVIKAAKVSDKPARDLTASEVQAIEPLLWKSKGEMCDLHEPERKKDFENGEALKFTLTPLDERHVLISTWCLMAAYQGTNAYWIVDAELKNPPKFLMEEVNLEYEKGVLSSSAKGRGVGDCWGGSTWVWDGAEFRLSQEWTSGSCSGIRAGGTWNIPTYVTEVKPAE